MSATDKARCEHPRRWVYELARGDCWCMWCGAFRFQGARKWSLPAKQQAAEAGLEALMPPE